MHHDVSAPLKDLAARTVPVQQPEEREVDELKVIPLPPGFKPATEPDPVRQNTILSTEAAATLALAPAAGLNFEGLGTGIFNFTIVAAPPDTEGAVGATQYVQWVNTSFAVFDKTTGAMTLGPVLGKTLWANFGGGCETNNDGDPIVNYDKLANRWVFTQFVVRSPPFLQCIAVSTTSDATGTYNRYSFQYSNLDDYPKLGVWPDAYYITFNMFQGGFSFLGADACAYDRNAMLQGLPATQVCFQQAPTVGGLLPADLDGHIPPPAGSPNYMLTFNVNSLDLYKFHVDFLTPSNSAFIGPINIPVAPFSPFCPTVHGCVPQPGGDGTQLDSLGDRLMYRLAYRNFGDHESLVVNHSVVADPINQNSGIRWYEIQNPNGTPVVAQQSTFAPDPSFRWMGSAAMDASGNLALGYSVTSAAAGVFPSIAIATRGAFDPPSTLQAETTIVSGAGSQTGGLTRWGDYSAMQVDPVDDCTFWYTQEYLRNNGSFNWNTRITNFKFPACGVTALTLTNTHAGNFTQGQTGATYTIVVTNVGGKSTDGTAVSVTDTLPTGLTATNIASTDPQWVCNLASLSCTRSDVLAPGGSYGPITVTVNVAANAPGLVTNTATVIGGGSKDTTDNTANDVTTVIMTGPDPAIAMTNVPLVANQSATYSITVTNRGLSATAAAPVTVTDTIPAGLTATAAGGTGWGTCTVAPTSVSCTRSDMLPSNQSYPPVVVSVNIGAIALTTVVNTATVSGGGDVNPLNNTVSDPATVLAAAPGIAFSLPAVPLVPSAAPELKPGVQIAIAGTATGPSFQDFRLQWAEGINPSSGFSSAGITLAGGGGTPVTNGPLGTWDTTGISKADFYTIRVTVDNAGFSNFAQTFIYLEPSLLSQHWPIVLDSAPLFFSGFQTLSDGSGNQQLFMVTAASLFAQNPNPQYRTFSPDGSTQTSTPLNNPAQLNPAAGQVDAFPGGDAVVPDLTPNFAPQLQLFHSDNSSTNVPLPTIPLDQGFFLQVPVVEDMEGAGQLDLVIFDALSGLETQAFLTAYRPDGAPLSANFPVTIPDQVPNVGPAGLGITFKHRVLVGDLRGDGSKEFVVIAGLSVSTPLFTLLKFSHDGTPVPWAVPQLTGTPAAMVLADLDHNGMLETILTVAAPFPSGALTMHVFQPDGTERPGWPVDLGGVGPGDFTFSHIMVGDLNRDGTEEIIEGHINGVVLHILEPDGTAFPGFSSSILTGLSGAMALADVDGDGFPEILVTRYGFGTFSGAPQANSSATPATGMATVQSTVSGDRIVTSSVNTVVPQPQTGIQYFTQSLLALRRDGSIARTWNLQGNGGNQPAVTPPTITVGDFDNDGSTDIAINYMMTLGGGTAGFLGGGQALVLTTGTPFNAAANDWPLVYQNPHNTAVMRRSVTISLTSPVAGGTVAGTTPITALTSGPVASVQFVIDGTNFGSAVTTAPYTLQWDTTQATVALHKLVAVAVDNTGRPVASAPLTVNVIRGNTSTVSVALTGGTSSSTFGDSLTFTATVTPNTATGSVTFFDGLTPISGAVTLSGGSASLTTSLLAAGTRNLTARYAGDSNFGGSSSPVLTQTVQPALLTITAQDSTRVYGGPAAFSGTITGARNGDVFTLHFSSPVATEFINNANIIISPPGSYTLTPSVTGLDLANYTVTAVNGTITVTPAILTITVPNASRLFGTNNPAFIPTVTGIVPGDFFDASASSPATSSSPVGQYPIVPVITGPNISRYNVNAVNGTLTVQPAPLTITADDSSGVYGGPLPVFSGTITGEKFVDTLVLHFSSPVATEFINNGTIIISPPGGYALIPSVTGLDVASYAVTAVNGTLTVTPATLTITAPNANRLYGTNNPQFTPTISGIVPGDSFTFGASSPATSSSPVGQYPIVPVVTGPNISRYNVNAVNGTLNVTQAGSTAALATSSASVVFGNPVTFTATVGSTTTGTPTGSIQFLDGATSLATVSLNAQGVAALTTSSLPAGSHSITAQYGGDTNFSGSLSPAVSEQINPVPDFSIVALPSTATIKAGGSATFTFTVTPLGGFNQAVTFSCAGLPAESQCVFAPSSVTPNGSAATSMLTITTTAPSAPLGAPPAPRNGLPVHASLSGGMLAMLWIAFTARSRRRLKSRLLVLVGELGLLVVLTSCGGGGGGGGKNPGTPVGTSSVTVTATAGSNNHPVTITLTITN